MPDADTPDFDDDADDPKVIVLSAHASEVWAAAARLRLLEASRISLTGQPPPTNDHALLARIDRRRPKPTTTH
jgi:hypothetical protein